MEIFLFSFYELFSVQNIILLFVGCSLALILGILPGLSSTEAILILLPFTFTLELHQSMILISAAYSSAFVEVQLLQLFGIPGTSMDWQL